MLFLGHRIRVINQQRALQGMVLEMQERCVGARADGPTEALVTLDFKMKLAPLYFQEKTVDHCGKRGSAGTERSSGTSSTSQKMDRLGSRG